MTELRDELRDTLVPWQDRLAEISKQIAQRQHEIDELRQTQKDIEVVLRRFGLAAPLRSTQSTRHAANGATRVAAEKHTQRVETLKLIFDEQGEELREGFTATALIPYMRDRNFPVTTATLLRAISELRDAGIVRADKKVRGGAVQYKLTRFDNNGGN